jgi:hypothetical protein
MVEGFSMHGHAAHRDSCGHHVAVGSTNVCGQVGKRRRSGIVNYIPMITCLTYANQLEIRLDFELALAKSWRSECLQSTYFTARRCVRGECNDVSHTAMMASPKMFLDIELSSIYVHALDVVGATH